ncbi:MAG: biopolymer transporter ExbD [Muribaculaceae bacterium]|nr:biopolymer transporter ExbD [Muribaculaceae bacterium]
MALKRQHTTLSMFSMASMTDIIFLLLIFFMVTSTFVFPSALEVNLPQSSEQTAIKPSTRIYVDKDLNMFATQQTTEGGESDLLPIAPEQLEGFMQALKAGNPDEFVAVYADEEVNYGKIVEILDKGSKQGVKIVLATKPSEATFGPVNAEQTVDVQTDAAAQPVVTTNP